MNKRHLPFQGCPSRQAMVRAAIYMERRGFDFREWSIISRLCDSSKEIRGYILSYAKDVLDMWDGLEPTRGSFSYEIANIAAFRAFEETRRQCRSKKRADEILDPPVPWTTEQYEAAREKYLEQDRVRSSRVTRELKEALEREASLMHGEPYKTISGCSIIPFPVLKNVSQTEVQRGKTH